jgi:N-methylhydantoinase A
VRVGVDIGGTFTDVVVLGDDGSIDALKLLSTPDDYARGVIEGIEAARARNGLAVAQVAGVVHASTIASNTVLEGTGARTALITTAGFRDVLEMRRLRIPVLYDIRWQKPALLVPRRRRYEVIERLGPRGEVRIPLDEASVREVAARIAGDDVDAVAICLLHSYADPMHERRVAEIVREAVGAAVFVTCSSEILPELREYERTSTTVVNAYVGPAVTTYLGSLTARLAERGFTAPLEVVQSAGGTMSPAAALRRPAALVESGPAAGVIACAHLARASGRVNVISFDMGGTTAKAAMLEDGEPVRTTEYEIGSGINLSSRLVKGGGHAIRLPFVDVSEIGAGGGSIVRVDEDGRATVGPRSAGSSPGPVSYGLGGTEPTLTDALLVLGRIDPGGLAGGTVPLDVAAAAEAIERVVARPLGLPLHAAAHGVLEVAVATMTRAVKAVSTYRGRDPRDFALCAFGGNGPVVGVEIARALRMPTVLVPPAPGVFSALGLLFSETRHELVRTEVLALSGLDGAGVEARYADLVEEARAVLTADGVDPASAMLTRLADLRYAGQAYELTVRVPDGPVDVAALGRAFVTEHVRTYGHGDEADPIDLVTLRLQATVPRASMPSHLALPDDGPEEWGSRPVFFGPAHGLVDTPVVARRALAGGDRPGPLLVHERDSTTVVPPGCVARLDASGTIEVDVDA